jgi:methylated-DNA-[protein]-cysteine S-methyltransferase
LKTLETLREVRAPEGFVDAVLRRSGLLDRYALCETAIGAAYVATSDEGISAVMQCRSDAEFEREYRERVGRKAERRDDLRAALQRAVAECSRETPVDLRGCNEFQRSVLDVTRRIPEGAVRPYSWIAREIGKPGAVRAVGTALAKNPVPLVIPCHRVVRSDGTCGEYAFGAPLKVALLAGEEVDLGEVRTRMSERDVFWSEEGEDSYCYPFCFAARPLANHRIRKFRGTAEAHAHGLTPCPTCRPPLAA